MSKFEERIFRVDNAAHDIDNLIKYLDCFLWEIVETEFYPSQHMMNFADFTCRRALSIPRIDELIALEAQYGEITARLNYAGENFPLYAFERTLLQCHSEEQRIMAQAEALSAEIRKLM